MRQLRLMLLASAVIPGLAAATSVADAASQDALRAPAMQIAQAEPDRDEKRSKGGRDEKRPDRDGKDRGDRDGKERGDSRRGGDGDRSKSGPPPKPEPKAAPQTSPREKPELKPVPQPSKPPMGIQMKPDVRQAPPSKPGPDSRSRPDTPDRQGRPDERGRGDSDRDGDRDRSDRDRGDRDRGDRDRGDRDRGDRDRGDRDRGDRDRGDRDRGDRDRAERPDGPPTATPRDIRRLDDFRQQRRETREGNRTVIREPGRTIVREGNRTIIRRNESELMRRGSKDARVERRGDEVRTIAVRPDGSTIITVTDNDGRLLRRIRRDRGGRETVLIDNRRRGGPGFAGFFIDIAPPRVTIPRERYIVDARRADRRAIYDTFMAPPVGDLERSYSLDEIRYTRNLREYMPSVQVNTVTFDTGSWEVRPDQVPPLEEIALAMQEVIKKNPNEVFLIEGHTDAVGADIDNLSLSDRRAESVAFVLAEEFGVPPENLTTQGYGEEFLLVDTQAAEERNRRVTVRRITPLLAGR